MKLKVIINNKNTSYLIDENIFIDLVYNDILPDNVFITKLDINHYFELPRYLFNLSKSDKRECNIYIQKYKKKNIEQLVKLAYPNINILNKLVINYNYQKSFKINDYNIDKILIDNECFLHNYAYLFSNKDMVVSFIKSDILNETIKSMAKISTYLVIDNYDILNKLIKINNKCKYIYINKDNKKIENKDNIIILKNNDIYNL